ncbi:hypothetical protein CTEN210_11492 [Chaetoceros tenuissimus]|uniref:Uncharacterized protein n=1 Tax=Chaetoceros tenuissimus TaxID=426638 RepID=A0AAD3CZH8_9STRA|nr:hypothetical protein CTEN210_11492 [Chaetoceros tenuissimus]
MIFEIEIANVGEHSYSYFLLAQDIDQTTSALEMRMDSAIRLDYEGTDIKLYKEQPINRQIRVTRGLTGYNFKPVKFALRSACEFAMDYETEPVTIKLYNVVENDEERLKWLEPCPTVKWVGELKRDRSFLINSQSSDPSRLYVKIFNPLSGRGIKLKDLKEPNGRILNVLLKYRKYGKVNWKNAMSEVGGGTLLYKTDFITAADEVLQIPAVTEDGFGYIGMDWYIGGGTIVDGTYEIVIESSCTDVGGPDEFKFYRDDIITGIFDRTKPEQYGKVLPLKEEILFGEDIVLMFTEDIDCSYPYTFDILLDVEDDEDADTDLKLEKGQLHIICEGRQIKFQVDYTQIDLELIQGRNFEVYIGKVGVHSKSYVADKNGNPLDLITGFIRFEKKFAAIDARRTLTEFAFKKEIHQIDCSKHNETTLSKDLVTDLSTFVDASESARWRLSDVKCYQPDSTISAKVEILPANDGRRKLKGIMNGNEPSSTHMFSKICKIVKDGNIHARKLHEEIENNFMISNVRFVYSDQDLKKYASTAEQKKEEESLLSVVKLENVEPSQSTKTSGEILLLQERLLHEKDDKLKNLENNIQELKDMEEKREEENSEILRQLRGETKASEKYEMSIQLLIFFGGCSLLSFATIQMIRR